MTNPLSHTPLPKEHKERIRQRIAAYKHWKLTLGGQAEWKDSPGPDIEALLHEVDRLEAELECALMAASIHADEHRKLRNRT